MGGARPTIHKKRFDCVEILEYDVKEKINVHTVQLVLSILTVYDIRNENNLFNL